MSISESEFRRLMAQFASGVTVVTTLRPGGFHGITVTAFCSLSLDPPLVLVCIDRLSQSLAYVLEAGVFAVNILSRAQMFLADRFAGRAPLVVDFATVPHHLGEAGVPLFDEALAWVECRVAHEYDGGDHAIVVGRVIAGGAGRGTEPLVYHAAQFVRLSV